MNNKVLYIGNLAGDTRAKDLAEQFTKWKLLKCEIPPPKQTHDNLYAFLEFDSHETAREALETMKDQRFNGRPLRIFFAKSTKATGNQGNQSNTSYHSINNSNNNQNYRNNRNQPYSRISPPPSSEQYERRDLSPERQRHRENGAHRHRDDNRRESEYSRSDSHRHHRDDYRERDYQRDYSRRHDSHHRR